MEDMMAQLSKALSDPAAMQQMQQLAQALMGGQSAPVSQQTAPPPSQVTQQAAATQAAPSPDLSSILGSLSGLFGSSNQGTQAAGPSPMEQNGSMPDLSSLFSAFGQNQQNQQAQQSQSPMPDLSMLSQLFGGQTGGGSSSSSFDIGKIAKIGEAIKNANHKDESVDLILALKPFLKEEKRAKADKIVKLMKILTLLPILKESGLLGGDLLGIL